MTEPRRFTTKAPVPFAIDDEEFHVLGAVPAEELAALLDLQTTLSGEDAGLGEQYIAIKKTFEFMMLPESWERFSVRLADRSRPIDFRLLLGISNWLSGEVWAGKAEASESPQPSTEPPAPDGPTSMDGAPVEESIPSEMVVSVVDSPESAT